jgi:hypothetical protein
MLFDTIFSHAKQRGGLSKDCPGGGRKRDKYCEAKKTDIHAAEEDLVPYSALIFCTRSHLQHSYGSMTVLHFLIVEILKGNVLSYVRVDVL